MGFIKKILNSFVDKFSNDVEIHMDPHKISFHRGINFFQCAPVLYISDIEDGLKILAVGDNYEPDEPNLKINIFDFDETSNKTPSDQIDLLIPFFSHCILRVIGASTLIRPKAIVHNLESLGNKFNDGDKKLIEQSLLEIGLRGCVFRSGNSIN